MVRQAWEALPELFFDAIEERRDAMTICLRAGLFRDVARALAESGSPVSTVLQALNRRPELDRFRKALARWGELLSVSRDAGPLESSLRTKLGPCDDISNQLATEGVKPHEIGVSWADQAAGKLGRARRYLCSLLVKTTSVCRALFRKLFGADWERGRDFVDAHSYYGDLTQRLAFESKVFVPLRLSPASPEASSDAELLNDIMSDKRSILELFKRDNDPAPCLAIIGRGGSGKTSLLRHLTVKLLREQEESSRLFTPILLSLGAWPEAFGYKSLPAVAAHLAERGSRRWLESRLRRGRCLILFDALDEVSDMFKNSAVDWVEQQISRYPGNRFIVASRSSRHMGTMMRSASVVELQPFTTAESMAFLEAWCSAHSAAPADRHAVPDLIASVSSFLRGLESSSRIVHTPLYLSLLAAAHSSGGSLSAKPADIWSSFLNTFLELAPEGKGHRLTQTEKRTSLQPLALHMMEKHTTQIALSEAALIIGKPLEELGVTQQSRGTAFLRELELGHSLFLGSKPGVYRFAHRTVQEFLAAAHLREVGKEPELVRHIADPWWHETIRFYAGLGDASTLVSACLRVAENSPDTLALARDCAMEARTLDSSVLALVKSVVPGFRERDRGAN
jgi:NACHT domain